jgi:hypothetical protein
MGAGNMKFMDTLIFFSCLQVVPASPRFILVSVPMMSYFRQHGTKNMVCSCYSPVHSILFTPYMLEIGVFS